MTQENGPPADSAKRLWMRNVGAMGGVGVIATAVPFVRSLGPSERARAQGAAVQVNTRGVAPGELATVEWRGRPVWILHRTPEMIERLQASTAPLADPASRRSEQPAAARNPYRSLQPGIGVLLGVCTHLGCTPTFRPVPGASAGAGELGADWPGGFFCPCHGSKFDLAGRVFKNVPAPLNLEVPQYSYVSATELVIGQG